MENAELKDRKTKDKQEETGIALVESNNISLDLLNDSNRSFELLGNLVKSGKITAKTPEEAAVYYLKAKELGLPFITTMSHMSIINGKAGVDIHVLKAMVLRAGNIFWEVVKEYEPHYKYSDGANSFSFPFKVPEPYKVVSSKEDRDIAVNQGFIPVFRSSTVASNFITEYLFTRQIKMLDGSIKTLSAKGKFSTEEAIIAGLNLKKDGSIAEDSPWIKYNPLMTDHRAWTFGARAIASDILFGLLEIKELFDINKKQYIVDTECHVIEDEDKGTVS